MKKSSPADKLSGGGEEDRNKLSGFGPISLVPARRKLNKVNDCALNPKPCV
jgi:hypothetical protein